MANIVIVLTFVLVVPFAITYGKRFSRCELAREMYDLGVPMSELPDWVCLARYESNYDTAAMNKHNTDNSWDWGIFQINDRYWCKPDDNRRSSNACGIACRYLATSNIDRAVTCARKILKAQGFKAWVAWRNHCQTNKPSVDDCF